MAIRERSRLASLILSALAGGLSLSSTAHGQFQMPDAREMAGIPRPVTDLPDGSVSVRLIRGDLSNNLPDHPVELIVDGEARTARTDESGRAQFDGLPAGATLQAVAVVDSERLESQPFSAPARGGIRLMLVATDPERAARAAEPAVPGEVVLGQDTRIVVEADEESVRVFYLLEITNNAPTPVDPPTPFIFDTPTGALSTTIMQGSSPQASASGDTVRVLGPFQPGRTFVQVGFALPAPRGSVEVTQTFPAAVEQLVIFVQRVGEARLTSAVLSRQQEMPAGGDVLIVGVSDRQIAAGQPIAFEVSGLPHHSPTPRVIALSLAVGILVMGAWAAWRPTDRGTLAAARKQLIARRERLFTDLVRLELDRRRGRTEEDRYAARRRDLMASLEHVYGALDTTDPTPGPTGRTGVAA